MKKYIPDFLTAMNLACGVVGVVFAFKGMVEIAFFLMLAGVVFDFFDGFAARALGAYSDFGKELDSLADLVTSGVLPAVMLYNLSKECMWGETWVCWVPLLIAVFAGLRLAKFNVDPSQADGFMGLPAPGCALLAASLCHYAASDPTCFLAQWCAGQVFIPVLTVCLCALLVCRIPMFSLKLHKTDPSALKVKRLALLLVAVVAVAVCLVFSLKWSLAVLLVMVIYVVKNIVYAIFRI